MMSTPQSLGWIQVEYQDVVVEQGAVVETIPTNAMLMVAPSDTVANNYVVVTNNQTTTSANLGVSASIFEDGTPTSYALLATTLSFYPSDPRLAYSKSLNKFAYLDSVRIGFSADGVNFSLNNHGLTIQIGFIENNGKCYFIASIDENSVLVQKLFIYDISTNVVTQKALPQQGFDYYYMFFMNNMLFIIHKNYLYHTVNNGDTWNSTTQSFSYNYRAVSANNLMLFKRSDGGETFVSNGYCGQLTYYNHPANSTLGVYLVANGSKFVLLEFDTVSRLIKIYSSSNPLSLLDWSAGVIVGSYLSTVKKIICVNAIDNYILVFVGSTISSPYNIIGIYISSNFGESFSYITYSHNLGSSPSTSISATVIHNNTLHTIIRNQDGSNAKLLKIDGSNPNKIVHIPYTIPSGYSVFAKKTEPVPPVPPVLPVSNLYLKYSSLQNGYNEIGVCSGYKFTCSNAMNVAFKMWSGGGSTSNTGSIAGGGSAYIYGEIALNVNDVLQVFEGSKGINGGGGSASSLVLNGTLIVVCGAGGGAGYSDASNKGRGGAGGLVGQKGEGGTYSGYGATQSADGAAGFTNCTAGSNGNGGNGSGTTKYNIMTGYKVGGLGDIGGGGGAGYYGGGGGSRRGGGGGSSFVHASITNSVVTAGNYDTPGNSSDSERGNAGSSDYNGLVLIWNI